MPETGLILQSNMSWIAPYILRQRGNHMTAHKHAALMLQYAQDAAETDTPWERWEWRGKSGDEFLTCCQHPSWKLNHDYRRKPQVIRVGRHEFPKPITQRPDFETTYWATMFDYSGDRKFIASAGHEWTDSPMDEALLEGNLCHLSREAAQAHADALNAICRGDVE